MPHGQRPMLTRPDRPARARAGGGAAAPEAVSLPEMHRSVLHPERRGLAAPAAWPSSGPGYLVAVGYMDPGNWATALAGGSAFGYTLLSVALLSSLMAMLLQALCARIGIATGRDLAQLCRDRFPRPVNLALWLLAEIAICATDLAELIGTAIALQLLFGIPLLAGVLLTALDALLILWLQHRGVRWLEALVAGLIFLVFGCFGIQLDLGAAGLGGGAATATSPAPRSSPTSSSSTSPSASSGPR